MPRRVRRHRVVLVAHGRKHRRGDGGTTVPIPGGGTAVGTVGLSAVLVSFGIPDNVAVAAALANQLVYSYLPAIPGWFATKHLFRHDYL